jgi:methionyl-tRNA formyltransferase
MKKIKIGYFADGPWSHLAFEKIIKDKTVEIAFITPRFDTKDEKLLNYAKSNSIDYLVDSNINSDAYLKKIDSYKCDLIVSMSFNQIFRKEIINLTPNKIINCHAGLLPFYRGRNILNWALINDEKKFGITVHYVDEGIDTGDIILQKKFEITDADDYSTLLEKSYIECANILFESIKLIQKEEVNRIPQKDIHPIGMYCGMRTMGDEILNWNQTSREVFNFVRAVSKPGPQAHTYLDNVLVKINKVRYIKEAPVYIGKPGQILAKNSEKTFLVKTSDSFIEILEYEGKLRVGKTFKDE